MVARFAASLVSVLMVAACSTGNGSADGVTTAPGVTPSPTPTVPAPTTAGPIASSTAPPPTAVAPTTGGPSAAPTTTGAPAELEPIYYVGSSSLIENVTFEGWTTHHVVFVHDDASGVEIGWHTVMQHPACDEPQPPEAAVVYALFETGPPEPCAAEYVVEQIVVADPQSVTADREARAYAAEAWTLTTTASWAGPDGQRESTMIERPLDTIGIHLGPAASGGDELDGGFTTPRGNPTAHLVRSDLPHPFNETRRDEFLRDAATWVPPLPDIEPLPNPPPTGITAVWFACNSRIINVRNPETGEIAEVAVPCDSETEEVRRATDALGWDLVTVTYFPGIHSAQDAYRQALRVDADVIFASGGLGGQWSDATVASLLADGVVIVDVGIDDSVGGAIDKSVLSSLREGFGSLPWPIVDLWRLLVPPVYVPEGAAEDERAWWAIDTAVRAIVTGDVVNATFTDRVRVVADGELPPVGDDFRRVFLDAWGV